MLDLNTPVYTMSIEAEPMKGKQHGFHLGTQEAIARQMVEEKFHGRVKAGIPTITIALIYKNRIVDVYDGMWSSEYAD